MEAKVEVEMVAVLVVVATVDTEARVEAVLVPAQVGTVVGLEERAAAAGQGTARCQQPDLKTSLLQELCCHKTCRSILPDTRVEQHHLLQHMGRHLCARQLL